MAEARYRARRDQARRLRLVRARRNLARTWPSSELQPVKPASERVRGATTLWLLAAMGFHGALAQLALSLPPRTTPDAEAIRVRIVNPPPAVAVEPEPIAAQPAAPEAPQHRAAPEPPPKRSPPKRSPPQPAPSPAEAPPPMVVGLTLESTSRGATGPSFAVGNSLLGATARTASAPRVRPAAPAPGPAPSRNRVARARPAAGVRVEPARRLSRIEPAYPPLLQSQRIEGDVGVRVSLAADGSVREVEIVRPARDQAFNRAALDAARKERFAPETHAGKPVPTSITYTYRFRISP